MHRSRAAALVLLASACRPTDAGAPTATWLVGSEGERIVARGVDLGQPSGCGCANSVRMAIDHRARRVIFAAGERPSRVWAADPAGGAPVAITAPDRDSDDVSPAVRPDGGLLFVRSRRRQGSWLVNGDVYLRDARNPKDAKDERRLTDDGGEKTDLRLVPGGRLLIWRAEQRQSDAAFTSEVLLADLRDGSVRPLGPR